jgi:hypothetical protein
MHQRWTGQPDEIAANLDQTDWFPDPSPAADVSPELPDSDDVPVADLIDALPDIIRNITESRVAQIWRPQDEQRLQKAMRFFSVSLLRALKYRWQCGRKGPFA